MRKVAVGAALGEGWRLFWAAAPMLLAAAALMMLIEFVQAALEGRGPFVRPSGLSGWIEFGVILGAILLLGVAPLVASIGYGAMQVVRGHGLDNAWLLRGYTRIGPVLLVSILHALMLVVSVAPFVLAALVAEGLLPLPPVLQDVSQFALVPLVFFGIAYFIVVTLLVSTRWTLVMLHVLDGNGFRDSLIWSWQTTGRHKPTFFGFVFVAWLLQYAAGVPGSLAAEVRPVAAIGFDIVFGAVVVIWLALAYAVLYEAAGAAVLAPDVPQPATAVVAPRRFDPVGPRS